jgi:hypothetical protein
MSAPRGVAVVLVALLVSLAALSSAAWPGDALASVSWPASTGLLVAEAVTGGASASDEYAEVYNAGGAPADLGGCELIYVTATGATTTRKALFASPLMLVPGAHLLVANSAGVYGPSADVTYTGGLASDGGSLALRHVAGAVIDALSWGTAGNSYVEGAVAPAPPAGSSLERRPGGSSGNWVDSNDNAADWVVRSNPVPQSLASSPVPAPSSPTPTPVPTPGVPTALPTSEPTGSPESSDSAPPLESPTPEPTLEPTLEPTPEPTGRPTPAPTLVRTPDPTPAPTLVPPPAPTLAPPPPSEPDVDLESIAAARAQSPGTRVHVAGAITVPVGLVGADNLFAIADSSDGVFVRLSSSVDGVDVGRSIDVVGVLAAPYGQLEVRELEWLQLGAPDAAPTPRAATLQEIGEGLEGSLVTVEGTIDSATTDGGRLILGVGDGQAELRVMADPATGLSKADVARGAQVTLTGILGQRATAVGREDGYRLWLRMRSDLVMVLASPSETASPTPSKTPRQAATPTPVPVYRDLATGLAARGRFVDVDATVTAAAGLIDWGGQTIVVDDGTAAVAVVLPEGIASPRVGAGVRVAGKTGSLHSGPRVVATLVEGLGGGAPIPPRQVAVALGPEHEWQLAAVCGRVQRLTRAGSRWRTDLAVDGQTVAVLGEPGAGISPSGMIVGRLAMVTGIVRRSTSDSSVFQLLPRSAADIVLGPAPASKTGGATAAGQGSGPGAPGASASASSGRVTTVSEIPGHEGTTVTVAGLIVETGPARATLDDGTGRIRLGGSDASDAISLLEPGDAVEVTGRVARDDEGWLIEVDPDLILSLAGTGPDAGTDPGAEGSGGAAPRATAASAVPEPTGDVASAHGQAHGLARSAGGTAGPDPMQSLALFAVGLVLLAGLGLGTAWAARTGRLRQLRHVTRRPPRVRVGPRERCDGAVESAVRMPEEGLH